MFRRLPKIAPQVPLAIMRALVSNGGVVCDLPNLSTTVLRVGSSLLYFR